MRRLLVGEFHGLQIDDHMHGILPRKDQLGQSVLWNAEGWKSQQKTLKAHVPDGD